MYVSGCQSSFWSDTQLSCLAKLRGDMSCSLPGNLGHPQSYTALFKSLKYSTCTVVVTVQKSTLTLSVSPSEPHFLHAAEYGNYVYFFYREIAVEHSNLGKVRRRAIDVHNALHIARGRPASKQKRLTPLSVHASLPQIAPVVMGPIQAMTIHRIRIHENFQQEYSADVKPLHRRNICLPNRAGCVCISLRHARMLRALGCSV